MILGEHLYTTRHDPASRKEIIEYLADQFLGQLYFEGDCKPNRRCPDRNHADYSGRTPLHYAALGRNWIALEFLVSDNRMDLYAEDRHGDTAFEVTDTVFRRCKPKFLFISGAGEGENFASWGILEESDFHPTVSEPYSRGVHFTTWKFTYNDDDREIQREFKDAIERYDEGEYDPIVVVAYSWGGETAVDWLNSDYVERNLPSVGSNEPHEMYLRNRIILVTLDPVGGLVRRSPGTPNNSLGWQATRWINVYGSYGSEDSPIGCLLSFNLDPDCLAIIGNRWKRVPFAGVQNIKVQYGHNDKMEMFRAAHPHLEEEMKDVCGAAFDLPEPPSDWEIMSHLCKNRSKKYAEMCKRINP